MSALLHAASVVMPVVLVLAIGNIFTRMRDFTPDQARGLAKLVFWVCLPTLIVRDMLRSEFSFHSDAPLCLGLSAVLLISAVLSYRFARVLKSPDNRVGVIAQAAFRSNMLYVGMPVLIYYVASMHESDRDAQQKVELQARSLVALTLAFAIPILNAASVIFFVLARRHQPGQQLSTWKLLKAVFSNPLFFAVVLGFVLNSIPGVSTLAGPQTVIGKTLNLVSDCALPLALFSVGAILNFDRAYGTWRETLPVATLKLVVLPLVGLLVLWQLGVRGIALDVGVILLACPTAAASHAMAVEMGGDEVLAGDLVVVSTLLCPITLVAWLVVLQKLEP